MQYILKSAATLPVLIGLAVGLFFNILVNVDLPEQPVATKVITKTVTVEKQVIRHDIPTVCTNALRSSAQTVGYAKERIKAYDQAMDALTDYSWWEARHALKKFKKANKALTTLSSDYTFNQAQCQFATDIANG